MQYSTTYRNFSFFPKNNKSWSVYSYYTDKWRRCTHSWLHHSHPTIFAQQINLDIHIIKLFLALFYRSCTNKKLTNKTRLNKITFRLPSWMFSLCSFPSFNGWDEPDGCGIKNVFPIYISCGLNFIFCLRLHRPTFNGIVSELS